MADSEDLKMLLAGDLDLNRCDFRDADLSGMDLRDRDFSKALLRKANCEGTRFDGCTFKGADLAFIQARGAVFDNCDLSGQHLGYVDFTNASLRNANAKGARFQNARLDGAVLSGATLEGGSIDADTTLKGTVADLGTNFDKVKVLRPTSRDPLFTNYTYASGILHRDVATQAPLLSPERADSSNSVKSGKILTSTAQLELLAKNPVVTRVTARTIADQIEAALHGIPATDGNQLSAPLQTLLEVAEALRGISPEEESISSPLERMVLTDRIAELEVQIDALNRQLVDANKAREAAEQLLKSDGFVANFKRSAGKGLGYVAASYIALSIPAAATYFLGSEHVFVKQLLTHLADLPS